MIRRSSTPQTLFRWPQPSPLCRGGAHPPLSVASSSGSQSPRASGPGRGTWPSAWPPPLSQGWRSSPVRPGERTNTRLQDGPARLVYGDPRPVPRPKRQLGPPVFHQQLDCTDWSFRCRLLGQRLRNSTTPPGVAPADELSETKGATSAAAGNARLVPDPSFRSLSGPLPHLQFGLNGHTLFLYTMINWNFKQLRKRGAQSPHGRSNSSLKRRLPWRGWAA